MTYRVTGLSPEPFRHLFGLPDEALAAAGAKRYLVDKSPGFPDRIGVSDAEPGETVLLVHHEHQPANTPYRASHAVFVRERPGLTYDRTGELPEALRIRLLSLRAFDGEHMMVDADIVEGAAAEPAIERLLADERVSYIHAHYAKRGCYAARIERA